MPTSSNLPGGVGAAFPAVEFDAAIIGKLSQSGPRYTSYPTADRFQAEFGYGQFLEAVAGLRMRRSQRPLSLYIHIPFCDTICYYCGCNKIVTKDHGKAATYLGYLKQELDMQGRLFAGMGRIEQLHFGGGTPTYLSDRQMGDLMAHLHHNFDFAPDAQGEYSIEIDPRTVSAGRVHALRAQGFNRISLGVQDFDAEVQKAVNRIQPEAETRAVIDAARDAGFRSVSIDLIYGLPKQSVASMEQTMAKVIDAGPDRIALYNYAHLPHLFKPQRRILEADLPSAAVKLELLALCIERLCAAGYVYIGMDHFAKPDDELAVAQRQGRLQRNFQGYSTRAEADLIACGVSAISAVGATYSQNEKTLEAYYAKLDGGVLPIARGIKLDTDDLLRRIVIQKLMCNFELSISSLEQAYPIRFPLYFAPELEQLKAFEADGLVSVDQHWISVTAKGRLLIRNICMVFDRYLAMARGDTPQPMRYSKPFEAMMSLTGYQLLPVFLVGLAGSVHCVGMCGGIVGAISASAGGKSGTAATAAAPRNVIPIRQAAGWAGGPPTIATIATTAAIGGPAAVARALPRVLAYNAGRIGSYMMAGALAGGFAGGAQSLARLAGLQLGFYWLANLMLVALGLYLMNAWHGLAKLEQAGRVLWQRAQPWMAPAMKTLMPAARPHQAFALGALWGWLPCGMVYSVLLTAMLSGGALDGAAVMLAFGLGTLPMLTGLGLLGARLRHAMQQRRVRIACGLLVLAFGALGIARAAGAIGGHALTPPGWISYA